MNTSEVIIGVNWPNYSEENQVELYDAANTLITTICQPTNCYVSNNANSSYTNATAFVDCLNDGGGYYLILYDGYGDGWNGGGSVTVTSGGNIVINALTFPNPGGGNVGEITQTSSTFTVSGGGGACTPVIISSYPYNESFENGFGAWTQDTGDDFNWTRLSGSTGSQNTGPDAASDGSFYFYTEASDPNNPNRVAILNGPSFDLSGLSFAMFGFDYHMFGAAMGTLELQLQLDGSSTWTTIWTQTGDQGNEWKEVMLDFNAYVGNTFKLRFRGTTGNGFTSDMAIDNITLSETIPGMTPANLNCAATANQITGTVYEDFDYSGNYSDGEYLGVENVVITATDSLNNSFTTTTDGSGNYVFNGLVTGRTYRITFTSIPDTFNPTFSGGDNGTVTQFVQPENCANLGVASPFDYCNENPTLVSTCFIDGNPLGGGTSGNGDVLVAYPYNSTGTTSVNNYLAINSQMGSVWGVAYQKRTKSIFTAAMLKRHADFGPLGIGGIYRTDYSNPASPTVENWLDLNTITNVGTTPRTDTLPSNSGVSSADSLAFSQVGKLGIGDIDISDNQDTLYVVNLNNNGSLLKIDIATKTLIQTIPFANPGCGNANDVRPWALKYYRGKVYVGLVCSGENAGAGDLKFFVQRLDGNSFTTILTNDLLYAKGDVHNSEPDACDDWEPWTNDFSGIHEAGSVPLGTRWCRPQPILADLEFGEDGSLYLGFTDRAGHQLGFQQRNTANTASGNGYIGGDILKAYNNNGTFVLESNGTAGSTGCGVGNNQGPEGGEFFCSDNFETTHDEVSLGSIAYLKGDNAIALNIMDPVVVFTGGTVWLDVSDGTRNRAYQVYSSNGTGAQVGTFGKAAGLGDVELLCEEAPFEIGNYVWIDADKDGIQDAGEAPLDSIIVNLYNAQGELVAVDTTNVFGEYYFNDEDIAVYTAQGDTQLNADSTYYVVIAGGVNYTFSNNILSNGFDDYQLTLIDQLSAGHPNSDIIDSDGQIGNGNSPLAILDGLPYTTFTIGNLGTANHNLDFGFHQPDFDYGDLPDLADGTTGTNDYETQEANGGPSHLIIDGLYLGDTVDVDMDGMPDAQAGGDDIEDSNDDEDGINIFPSLDVQPGGIIRLPLSVVNMTDDTAHIEAWIDWNGDGDFNDANEMVANLNDNADGIFPAFLEIPVPDNPLEGSLLGFRVRLSNSDNMTPEGRVYSGEVEDYLLGVSCPQVICVPVTTNLELGG